MTINPRGFALSLFIFTAGGLGFPISAVAEDTHVVTGVDRNDKNDRTDYRFRQKFPSVEIAPYNTIVYAVTPNGVATMRGDFLYSSKKSLSDLHVIPTGVSFGVIETDKKGQRTALFYSTIDLNKKLSQFDVKRYGEPSAIAYTADGKHLLVATDSGLYIFEPRKMILEDQMEIPFTPTRMTLSDNGYYLAIADADRVAVYNFEEKKQRRDWNYGVTVNDMTFNNESSEFAVLTADGLLTVYDTRRFNIKNDLEDLGDGRACAFTRDGKYIAVAVSDNEIEMVNLVRPEDRNTIRSEEDGVRDLCFIKDADGNSILAYTGTSALYAKRTVELELPYKQLVADEVERLMDEWQKMMPGESMEAYRLRVNDETRAKQRRLFADEISTRLAGDLLAGETMSLGEYDSTNQVLALDFSKMPTIYLPVPENDMTAFKSVGDLLLSDVQYGVLPDDTFEIIYAKVFNKRDGKTYVYNNTERTQMALMKRETNLVSLEILQQQQMEELRLQEIRRKVVDEAKHNDLISNHTNISVDSRIVPDFNADGKRILNYEVNFTYQVDPEFSASEDFPPGKYTIEESGAANAMLQIVKEAFEGDFAQYLKNGKKLKVIISGTADATPIIRTIPYDGSYGDFENEPIYENGSLTAVSVSKDSGVKENRQLAFLRAQGVKNYLENNVANLANMNTDYTFKVDVTEGKGSEFRRITTNFIFVDVF